MDLEFYATTRMFKNDGIVSKKYFHLFEVFLQVVFFQAYFNLAEKMNCTAKNNLLTFKRIMF